MTIAPEFRKSKCSEKYSQILPNIGALFFKDSCADVIIAPARKDVGVHHLAYSIGFKCIQKDIMQRNFLCDMVALDKKSIKPIQDVDVKNAVERVWKNRKDFAALTVAQSKLKVVEAA